MQILRNFEDIYSGSSYNRQYVCLRENENF